MTTRLMLGAFAFVLVSAAHAQSITTLFASNNSGGPGGGVYFDVTVAGTPLTITGFDVNTNAAQGTPFGFQVHTFVGTHVGNHVIGPWALAATGNGLAAGLNGPSAVALDATFDLAANTTYAFALILADAAGGNAVSHAYTNGTGANQNFNNADIALSLGTASNVAFSGSAFSPRVWNGTIYYSPVPEPATIAILGLGIAALALRRLK